MLCGLRKEGGQKVFASSSEKAHGPFVCINCGQELILKKGRIKIHYFSHKPPHKCSHGSGESEAHRKCKISIFNSLSNFSNIKELAVEVKFNTVIADIYCLIDNVPVAIEIQKSNLSVNEITQRTEAYHKLGIYVIWVGIYNEKLSESKYSTKAWEKWCHAVYFGRVYYWKYDSIIIPVHFSEYQLYVEASSWYDEFGEEQSAGGYYKSSKRYKTPCFGNELNLANDFTPRLKQSWSRGSVYVPQCTIFADRKQKWWA
ncbi:hypothetical protein V4V60_003908 [Vibrio mimicus]|uniref:competence protein CoiA n=1 Tax=Vibrio cholerae TaxID=666 RepID=UPI001E5275B3|nr:competence protein CoiA family protein [Vibrio cholerae]MCD1213173.1 competence protein CoiA [Vibrio cholerae]HDI3301478.1 hypothetical protein [Vibrio cholerae]